MTAGNPIATEAFRKSRRSGVFELLIAVSIECEEVWMKRRLFLTTGASAAWAQMPQNPSPMVEHTRAHERLENQGMAAREYQLSLGTLFVPARTHAMRSP